MACPLFAAKGLNQMPQIEDFQPIEWNESMLTGIADIDKQHQYLVDTLQEANKKLLSDDNNILLRQIVRDLLGYAIMHFETEETLMQRYGYDKAYPEEAQSHIAQHRDFSRQVVMVRDQLREGCMVSREEVLSFLNHWLREHVFGTDQLLGKYLIKKLDH
jgi:hemerythrin-like metal-binding protein